MTANSAADCSQALILSGGGASGAYEIGVMKALFEGRCPATAFRHFQPGIFAGTSVGAINASLLLSSPAPSLQEAVQQLEYIYLQEIAASAFGADSGVLRIRANPTPLFNPANYRDLSLWPRFLRDAALLSLDFAAKSLNTITASTSLEERLVDLADLSLLVDTSALRRLITRYLDTARVAASNRRLRIMTTNWTDGTLRVFRGEDFATTSAIEIILASSAIPGIFTPVPVEGTPYADGGIVMNAALKPCIDAGAEEIHLVYVDPAVKEMKINPQAGTASVFIRTLTIALAAFLNRDLDIAARVNLGLAMTARSANKVEADPVEARKANIYEVASEERRRSKGLRDPTTGYRPLTIHRYRPDESTGTLSWFDFSRDRIARTIEQGYQDALRHDCVRQQCILP